MIARDREQPVRIPMDADVHEGALIVPPGAKGLVLFAHGVAAAA